ncbi:polyadenylate-binding protein-interacting protein 1 [Lampris incognitus]|uniref:polyadenylate-binding protein-interacting protein 1 n=1 Tax=Lampris incognitus TaxID=2546036 RepID=UPI0024B54661|nr:polyadenylate-binding protein-interacting protein 1 [Lampris incognitus]
MSEHFDRAPGAGRARVQPASPGLFGAGDADASGRLFSEREPLRQPRTSPPLADSISSVNDLVVGGDTRRQTKPQQIACGNSAAVPKGCNVETLAKSSTLSANAPEFVPSGIYVDPTFYDGSENYYGEETLADLVADFLYQLSSSPGSFDSDVEHISYTLNSWVTTEALLQELVELIFTQSTAIPNFSYTGARLCNYLSHHLTICPTRGNFRQLLLERCQTEFKKKDAAVTGDQETQKSFHSFVLFLGELYLNLEVKRGKRPPTRADILLGALKDLLNCLLSHPVDANLICAVKLLKLTGCVLEDTWKESGKSDMKELIQRIENVVLDASCSRDVKQMLLKLVELRSSNWGRVHAAAATSNATPDNDPNYFMNEPTFYTVDGTPFTAADPEYSEKYQEILDREDYFPDFYEENGNDSFFLEEEMDPEIEEAFEDFCLEAEKKRGQ